MQQRQPGAAITQVLHGARERAQVARDRTLAQWLEPHTAHGDARRLQRQRDRHRVMPRADQHRNRRARLARPALAHQRADLRRLAVSRLAGYRMHMHAAVQSDACRERGQIADRRQARIVRGRKYLRAEAIHPVDERRRGAEVAAQLERRETQRADALVARAQEQADLGLAELVDRLHRITDRKQRAAIARLPARGERAQQFKLVEGGILKFIDQHVADRVATAQRQVGRLPLLGQAGARRAGDCREIHAPLRRELELQLGRCVPQQQRQRRERRRVFRRNRHIGEREQLVEGRERSGNFSERCHPFPDRALLVLVLGPEAVVLVPLLAPLARAGDRQSAHEAPAGQVFGRATQRTSGERLLPRVRRVHGQRRAALEERRGQAGQRAAQAPGDHRGETGGDPRLQLRATTGAVGHQDPRQPVGALGQHQDQQLFEARPIVVDPREQQLRGRHQFAIGQGPLQHTPRRGGVHRPRVRRHFGT